MSTKSCFICCQTPNSQVVNLLDSLDIKESVLDNVVAEPRGGCFHEDTDCVSQNADCGGQYQNTENESADWINYGPCGLEVDDKSGSENTLG